MTVPNLTQFPVPGAVPVATPGGRPRLLIEQDKLVHRQSLSLDDTDNRFLLLLRQSRVRCQRDDSVDDTNAARDVHVRGAKAHTSSSSSLSTISHRVPSTDANSSSIGVRL